MWEDAGEDSKWGPFASLLETGTQEEGGKRPQKSCGGLEERKGCDEATWL